MRRASPLIAGSPGATSRVERHAGLLEAVLDQRHRGVDRQAAGST